MKHTVSTQYVFQLVTMSVCPTNLEKDYQETGVVMLPDLTSKMWMAMAISYMYI